MQGWRSLRHAPIPGGTTNACPRRSLYAVNLATMAYPEAYIPAVATWFDESGTLDIASTPGTHRFLIRRANNRLPVRARARTEIRCPNRWGCPRGRLVSGTQTRTRADSSPAIDACPRINRHDKGGLVAASRDQFVAINRENCERRKTGQNHRARRVRRVLVRVVQERRHAAPDFTSNPTCPSFR